MSIGERVAVVTGGGGAIGSAIVEALEASGHRTVAVGRTSGDVRADLSSETRVKAAAAEILATFGRCDILVHCAGLIDPMSLEELEATRWRAVHAVNVEAALWLAQAFAPGMSERHFGRIIFVGSNSAWAPPTAEFLPYVASKGSMFGVMRALAVTLGGDGVAVTAVAPGLIDSRMARSVVEDSQFDAEAANQALKRRLVPQDTAHTVAFLASDGAEALTGQVLVVDGGMVMR